MADTNAPGKGQDGEVRMMTKQKGPTKPPNQKPAPKRKLRKEQLTLIHELGAHGRRVIKHMSDTYSKECKGLPAGGVGDVLDKIACHDQMPADMLVSEVIPLMDWNFKYYKDHYTPLLAALTKKSSAAAKYLKDEDVAIREEFQEVHDSLSVEE